MARVKSAKPTRRTGKRVKAQKPRRRSLWWRLLRWPLRAMLAILVFCVLWVGLYRFIALPGGIYMAAEAWEHGGIRQDWRPIEEISPRLVRSVMAAEDARFCDHLGFDFEAIREAMRLNEQGTRTYGASTITQQTAKNVFLWHQRSWVRKGLEAGFYSPDRTALVKATHHRGIPQHGRVRPGYLRGRSRCTTSFWPARAGTDTDPGLPACRRSAQSEEAQRLAPDVLCEAPRPPDRGRR